MKKIAKYKQNERQSNIELLRILAIMGVIVLHYNNTSMGGDLRTQLKEVLIFMYYIFWSPYSFVQWIYL